jgi:hypothetical protein
MPYLRKGKKKSSFFTLFFQNMLICHAEYIISAVEREEVRYEDDSFDRRKSPAAAHR